MDAHGHGLWSTLSSIMKMRDRDGMPYFYVEMRILDEAMKRDIAAMSELPGAIPVCVHDATTDELWVFSPVVDGHSTIPSGLRSGGCMYYVTTGAAIVTDFDYSHLEIGGELHMDKHAKRLHLQACTIGGAIQVPRGCVVEQEEMTPVRVEYYDNAAN